MEKINKTKLVVIIIIALVVIAAITLGVIFLGKGNNGEETNSKAGTISNTDSEFEALRVKDIELKYREESNETILDFAIENTKEEKAEKLTIQIQLLDENDNLISGIETYVETIDGKSEHKVNMTLGGNIQGIKKIKLVKPQQETPTE